MSTDPKKDPTGKSRVSRRVECLKSGPEFLMPDIYAEPAPIDRGDPELVVDRSGQVPEHTEKFPGFNPYDTGTLYKQ